MPNPPNESDTSPGLREDASLFLFDAIPSAADFRDAVDEFLNAWDAAEAAIKEAELFRKKVVFASIKELRYAGRRFTDALKLARSQARLSEDQCNELNHLLLEATENCIRARNDAVDSLITYLHNYFHTVKKDYGPLLMNAYFPGFTELFVRLNEIGQVIPASRGGERDRRNAIYDKIVREDIPRVKDLYAKIETSKDLIDEDAKRVRRTQVIRDGISWSLGGIGLLIALIAWWWS